MSRPPDQPSEAEIDAADAALLFKEPPLGQNNGPSTAPFRAALRRHPGEWAVFSEAYSSSSVAGGKWAAEGFEVATRINPKVEGEKRTYMIYVRYVGVES